MRKMQNIDLRDHLRAKIALGALFLIFSYVIYHAAKAFSWDGRWFLWSFSILSVFFTVVAILSFYFSHSLIRRSNKIGAYWSGWLGVFFGSTILFDLIEHLSLWTGVMIVPAIAGIVALIVAAVIIAYGTWQSTSLAISSITITIPGLPDFWHGKKIAFISDLHLGNVHSEKFAQKISERVEKINPEIILIGGDLYDGVAGRAHELIAPLKKMHAPLGTYFITGNHEYFRNDIQRFFDAITDAGIKILKDEVVNIEGLSLIGVDYRSVKKREDFKAVLGILKEKIKNPSILLKHIPEDLDIVAEHGISLVLSGHTHNGQIWPMNYCGLILKEFYYGHHTSKETQIYVSSGAGTQSAPFRLGTKSEIVAITLEKI